MKSLFEDMRSEQNLFSAWRHVKRSALNSTNSEIRGYASEFEQEHQRHLHRIGRQLREGRFEFDSVKGILKDKRKRLAANKDPRPISIATLKNRVVQRSILQVLQPRKPRNIRESESRFELIHDPRLGKINEINRSKYGVGGLMYPYGGVRPAISLVTDAINNGANFYFQSDIKSFFTAIRTKEVVDFVRQETRDHALADIFADALEVHLSNEDELQSYARLFPSGAIGVAQGSSLSAFAGNVLLFELDHELNGMEVTAVRYIDDIVIVSSAEEALERAVTHAKQRLKGYGFALYHAVPGSDKAARGKCSDAFNFLGCTIQPNRCIPSAASIERLKKDIEVTLSSSRVAIGDALRERKDLDIRMSKSATLHSLGRKIFGWYKSFSFCTERSPFVQLDKQIFEKVENYEQIISRKIARCDARTKMMVAGIPSTSDLHRK